MSKMLSRTELFGESIFTTLLVGPHKHLLDFDLHWERLSSELEQYPFEWDPHLEKQELISDLLNSFSTFNLDDSSFYRLRISYSPTLSGYPVFPNTNLKNHRWNRFINFSPLEINWKKLPQIRARVFTREMDQRMQFNAKVGSYGKETLYYLKQIDCNEWDEYLWVGKNGHIQECSRANIFLIKSENHWLTPPDEYCYNGLTRQRLMDWLPSQKIKVDKNAFNISDAQESLGLIFVNATNLMGEIILDNKALLTDEVKQKIRQLRYDFFLDRLGRSERKLKV